MLRVYNLHGRRDNKYKARIKILVDEMGLDAYRFEVEAEFAAIDKAPFASAVQEYHRIAQNIQRGGAKLEAAKRPWWIGPSGQTSVGWITMSAHTKCLVTPWSQFP